MISATSIQKVKELPVEEVIGKHLDLKRKGNNLQACCPLHGEKTPSFSVNTKNGYYKCFGCGKGGDAIDFIMELKGYKYIEAVQYIAQEFKIAVEQSTPEEQAKFEAKEAIRTTYKAYQQELLKSATKDEKSKAEHYWEARGIKPEVIKEFGLGYLSSDNLPKIPKQQLSDAGLVSEKGYHLMNQRYTVPITDMLGNIIAFGGRGGDGVEPKWMNSLDHEAYHKSKVLFNLHRARVPAREMGEITITEGYPDVMAVYGQGYKPIVAVCGTAFTEQHGLIIEQLAKGNEQFVVNLAFNDDEAGRKATKGAIEVLLKKGIVVQVIKLKNPHNKKGYDLLDSQQDGTYFSALRQEAIDVIGYYIEEHFKDATTVVQKAGVQKEAARLIALLNEDMRRAFVKNYARALELTERDFSAMVASQGAETQASNLADEHIIKVLDDYYQFQNIFDPISGLVKQSYVRRKEPELKKELGAAYLKKISRYDNFTVEPRHVNYRKKITITHGGVTTRLWNQYEPLPQEPKEFALPKGWDAPGFDYENIPEIANTARYYKHIYNAEKYGLRYVDLGWDYFAIMYLHPHRLLPARCFYSKAEATGKSTLINYELSFYGGNAVKTTTQRLTGSFNSSTANKVLICVEETYDGRGDFENLLKDLITGQDKIVEAKFQDARVAKSFDHYLFASNHADFMKVSDNTTRFIVFEVPVPKERDNTLLQKMIAEIPYVMYFLQQRGIRTPDKDRLWFEQGLWETDEIKELRQSSKDLLVQNIEEMVQSVFIKCNWKQRHLKLSSRLVLEYLEKFGGQGVAKGKSPTSLAQALKNRMGLQYTAYPTTYKFPQIPSMPNAEKWDHTESYDNARYITFPMERYLTINQMVEYFKEEDLMPLFSGDPDIQRQLREGFDIMASTAKEHQDADNEDLPF